MILLIHLKHQDLPIISENPSVNVTGIKSCVKYSITQSSGHQKIPRFIFRGLFILKATKRSFSTKKVQQIYRNFFDFNNRMKKKLEVRVVSYFLLNYK